MNGQFTTGEIGFVTYSLPDKMKHLALKVRIYEFVTIPIFQHSTLEHLANASETVLL